MNIGLKIAVTGVTMGFLFLLLYIGSAEGSRKEDFAINVVTLSVFVIIFGIILWIWL